MPVNADSPKLSILHVLTLNGRNGEFGGPVRVARELCTELNSRGHATHIFSGARKGSEPRPEPGLSESFILVKPILRRLAVSSLWSWKLIRPLNKLITNADVVHIHFARDLVPFIAAFLVILKKKPFITQTHGMIISDGRTSTRITDFFLTKPLINRSRINLVLTEIEMSSIEILKIKSPAKILPNGIAIDFSRKLTDSSSNRVVFCSRLDKRKGIDKFIDLADSFRESDLVFEIYGPDGGELKFVKSEIMNRGLEDVIQYKDSLTAEAVQSVLKNAGLLVLPSENEPYPMVILESLAVGTPVLIMPSCGLAQELKEFDVNYVAKSESVAGIMESFEQQYKAKFQSKSQIEILEFCRERFNIQSICKSLELVYDNVLKVHD